MVAFSVAAHTASADARLNWLASDTIGSCAHRDDRATEVSLLDPFHLEVAKCVSPFASAKRLWMRIPLASPVATVTASVALAQAKPACRAVFMLPDVLEPAERHIFSTKHEISRTSHTVLTPGYMAAVSNGKEGHATCPQTVDTLRQWRQRCSPRPSLLSPLP
jgi:hypothetical protein